MDVKTVFQHLHPRRLNFQIALLGALLLATVITLYTWYIVEGQTEQQAIALENQAVALAKNASAASAPLLVTRRFSDLEELLLGLAEFPDVITIQIATREGRVLSTVVRPENSDTPHTKYDMPPLVPPLTSETTSHDRGDRLEVWDPIEAGEVIGWIHVEYNLHQLRETREHILRRGILTGLLSVIVAVALFVTILRRPLRGVERATSFAGRLDKLRGTPFPVDESSYEVEQLGRALNRASMRLSEQERSLASTTKRLQAILTHAIDGIVILDANGLIETLNPAAERMFGCTTIEVVGQPFNQLVPDFILNNVHESEQSMLQASLKPELRIEFEAEALRIGGSSFPIKVGLSSIQTEDVTLLVGIVRDITEQKRLDRMKNDFISSVSHELRTPLTSMHGSLGLMASGDIPVGQEAQSAIEIAYKNSARLVRLINDILTFEDLDTGQLAANLRDMELLPLIQQAIADNQDFARQRNVELSLEEEIGNAKVCVDSVALLRAVKNLLFNAIHISGANNTVDIKVSRNDQMLRIAITDHGPGIPPESRKYLFKKFVQVQADDQSAQTGTGLGLGLSISKAIIDHLGGTLDFESTPNVATTFVIQLPEA